MPYLLTIGFDNSARLRQESYVFTYEGIRFKLIQNDPAKYQDVLLSLVKGHSQEEIYTKAAEFLSALSWRHHSLVTVGGLGGMGHGPDDVAKARCNMFTFPRIPPGHAVQGYELIDLPAVETLAQRGALDLYREALSSNSDFLAVLFYWQILETGGTDAIGWINKSVRHNDRWVGRFCN